MKENLAWRMEMARMALERAISRGNQDAVAAALDAVLHPRLPICVPDGSSGNPAFNSPAAKSGGASLRTFVVRRGKLVEQFSPRASSGAARASLRAAASAHFLG